MALTQADVLHVAALARLAIDDADAERLAAELSGILGHMDVLRTADVTAVPPMAAVDVTAVPPTAAAPDESGSTPGRAEPDLLAVAPSDLAPAWRDGFFTVPRLPHASGAP